MNTGLFNVLHDAGDDHVRSIAQCIDIDLGCVFKEVVDQHRALLRILDGGAHVPNDGRIVIRDDHGASAKHITGPDQHRVVDTVRSRKRLVNAGGKRTGRLWNLQVHNQLLEALTIFGKLNRS